ncbi:MAG TPA: ThuA domain-containing protein [Verrucomicrobiae bacterium]|jgi:trehalose utilization protein|nr:ThuA domain-containing protein [Verrucomicrobiae bacterium]
MSKLLLFVIACFTTGALHAAPIRVVVWDEQSPAAKKAYTNSIGDHIANYLRTLPDVSVKSVSLADPDQGVSDDTISNCDVLIWWSHVKNKLVPDDAVKKIVARVKDGSLSLIALHSALTSKVFIESMNERTREDAAKVIPAGTQTEYILPKAYKDPRPTDPITPRVEIVTNWPAHDPLALVYLPICEITGFREGGNPSHVTTLMPEHPIARDVPKEFDIAQTEVYLEPFHVPHPDAVIFHEKYSTGEEFRTGMLWSVGKGKVFYFRPEHETFAGYDNPAVLKVIANAVEWMGKSVQ